jgi:hypothetical protein
MVRKPSPFPVALKVIKQSTAGGACRHQLSRMTRSWLPAIFQPAVLSPFEKSGWSSPDHVGLAPPRRALFQPAALPKLCDSAESDPIHTDQMARKQQPKI